MTPVFSRVPTLASAATASDDEEGTFGDREDEGSEIEQVEMDLPPSRACIISVTEGVSGASAGRVAARNRCYMGNVSSPRPRAETVPRKPVRGRRRVRESSSAASSSVAPSSSSSSSTYSQSRSRTPDQTRKPSIVEPRVTRAGARAKAAAVAAETVAPSMSNVSEETFLRGVREKTPAEVPLVVSMGLNRRHAQGR